MGSDLIRVGASVLVIVGLMAAGPVLATGSNTVRVPGGGLPITAPSEMIEVVVQPGDHLWKISSRHLGGLLGRNPVPGETAPYWREVIAANRDRLRSGHPDLIYPGEVIGLP